MRSSLLLKINTIPSKKPVPFHSIIFDFKTDLKQTYIPDSPPDEQDQRGWTCGPKALEISTKWGFPHIKSPRARRHSTQPKSSKEKAERKDEISWKKIAKQEKLTEVGEILNVYHFKTMTNRIKEFEKTKVIKHEVKNDDAKLDEETYIELVRKTIAEGHSIILSVDIGNNGFPAEEKGKHTHWVLAWGYIFYNNELYFAVTHWGEHYLFRAKDLYKSNKQLPKEDAFRHGKFYKNKKEDTYSPVRDDSPPLSKDVKIVTLPKYSLENFKFTGFAVPAPEFKNALENQEALLILFFQELLKGNINKIMQILEYISPDSDLSKIQYKDQTALDIALQSDNSGLIELLLRKGIKATTSYTTALFNIIYSPSEEKPLYPIMEEQSSLTQSQLDHLFFYAIKKGKNEVLDYLKKQGARPLLHKALFEEKMTLFKNLLPFAEQSDLDVKDDSGNTLLLRAIYHKKYEAVEKLFDNKITPNFNIKNDENNSALYLLMKNGKDQLVQKLIHKSKGQYLDLYEGSPSPYLLAKENQRYKAILPLILNKHNENCKRALLTLKNYIEEFKWDIADHNTFKTISLDNPKRQIRVPKHVFEHWKLIRSAQHAKNQNEIWAKLYDDIMTNVKKIKKEIDEMPIQNKAVRFIMAHLSSVPKKPTVKAYFKKILAGEKNPLYIIHAFEEQEKELVHRLEKKIEVSAKSPYPSLYQRRAEFKLSSSQHRSSLTIQTSFPKEKTPDISQNIESPPSNLSPQPGYDLPPTTISKPGIN